MVNRLTGLATAAARNAVMRKVLLAAAKPVVAAAKRKVPVRTGGMRATIGTKVVLKEDVAKGYVVIGPLRTTATSRRRGTTVTAVGRKLAKMGLTGYEPAAVAHLVERGHRLVRGGRQVGQVAGKPFLGPAVEETRQQVMAIITQMLEKHLLAAGV